MRRLATCLKWEVGALTSAKANGPLNIKGHSLWLAYIYMQLLVTHVYVSMIEGISLNLGIAELIVPKRDSRGQTDSRPDLIQMQAFATAQWWRGERTPGEAGSTQWDTGRFRAQERHDFGPHLQ